MKIALCQIDNTVGDLAGNTDLIVLRAAGRRTAAPDSSSFPNSRSPAIRRATWWRNRRFLERTGEALEPLAEATAGLPCGLICRLRRPRGESGRRATNCAALIENGASFRQTKMLLPTYDVFDEARYFCPAEAQRVC